MKGSEILVEMLKEYEVKYIFGVPGDTGVPFYDALYYAQADIQHVMARDERSAAFMADAYARVSFKPGICEGPSGGGATYIVPGVAEAHGSSIPMIVLTTDNPISYEGKGALTALDQQQLFGPVTKWTVKVKRADMIPHVVRRAFRIATTGRPGAVQITLPKDILDEEAECETEIYAEKACATYPAYRTRPNAEVVTRAAELLLQAQRPVIIAGGGAVTSRAWAELTRLAEILGAPVGTTINGKGSISEDHPLSIGVVGGNGGRNYANEIVRQADLILYVGTKVNYVDTADWSVPPLDLYRKILHIDIDPSEIGNNYRTEVGLVGDAKLTLLDLTKVVESAKKGHKAATWSSEMADEAAEWWQAVEEAAHSEVTPIKPQRVIMELYNALPADSIIVADPGTPTPFVASQYKLLHPGRRVIIPRAQGGLGYAIPAVVGAKLARPEATVVGLCGDGSFAMSAGDLATIKRVGEPVVLIQFNNGCYGWIKMLQKLYCEARFFSVDFTEGIDYTKVAEGFGLRSFLVERPQALGGAIREALATEGPAFIDVITEPETTEVPPVEGWHRALERMTVDK